ncbi:MAG: FecR family protein [Candidatus Sulfotelmatobacter sp.]
MYKPGLRPLLFTALACALSALPAMADSQVRIVRLSDVQGTVQINKNSGLGFERAFMNLPITQGTQLRTLESGRAEVEFEDGSTLRLVPNTTVVFSRLTSHDASNRFSTVNLVEGKAYINWLGKSGDEFALNFSGEKVELKQAAHFRVEDSLDTAELANFKNAVEVEGPSGAVKVEKNKTVTFDVNDPQSRVAKNVKPDPYDKWDAQSNDYHNQYAKNNPSPYGYGVSDLSYYGGYSNVPGYGMLWQPYFAGAAWNPFMDGAWSWYPGMGFMWASAYPWGWMPYYYGNWMYAPGYGWGWQPGTWNTWHGGLHYVGAMAPAFHAPVAPSGTVRETVVGRGGAEVTKASATMLVSAGSAGLGVPRGSYDNLRGLNRQVAKSKTGMVELHAAPQFAATAMRSAPAAWGYGGMRSGGMSGMGHAGPGAAGHSGGAAAGGGGHAR